MKTFKTKKVLKIFDFFSVQCTGCVVRWSAEISHRSEIIQALLKIDKRVKALLYILTGWTGLAVQRPLSAEQ
jgi:hypothetical protein